MSEAHKGKIYSEETKAKISESIGIAIKVFDKETNVTSNYTSIKRAAKAIGVSDFTLRYHFFLFFVLTYSLPLVR